MTLQDNILIGPEGQALIADFGCSRLEIASQSWAVQTASHLGGTANYWAPELLQISEDHSGDAKMRKQSDVWAFGMTIYVCGSLTKRLLVLLFTTCTQALLAKQAPYAGYPSIIVVIPISKGELPGFSEEIKQSTDHCITALRNIGSWCWKVVDERPDMDAIVKVLEEALSSWTGQSYQSLTL